MDGETCPSATPKCNPHNQKSLSTLSDRNFSGTLAIFQRYYEPVLLLTGL